MVHLSTSDASGQVIVAGFDAGDPPEALRGLAQRGALGGFILFRRNLGTSSEIVELINDLRALAGAGPALWIGVDQEGGRVARLRAPIVALPPMRALGEVDDPSLTREAALILGHQLRLLGFNLDFAPVLDVDTNPENPVIGDRSFGREPERVIRHARAFAEGLRAAGVTACGKHFPGHGDTLLDSHLALPRLSHARERLDRVELRPFAELCGELPALMTAHVVFDALDPGTPATLSRRIVSGLLRSELGFAGLVFSDDLEMKAISEGYRGGEAACLAIEAGCDTLLICSKPERVLEAREALIRRAEGDAAFAQRLHDAAARSLAARAELDRGPVPPLHIERRLCELQPDLIEARIAAARPTGPIA
jgi:beta-N-acetylhexosaminidase